MKEIHNQSFSPVLARLLAKIYGPFFVVGLLLCAVLRLTILNSDGASVALCIVFVLTIVMLLLARKLDKKSVPVEGDKFVEDPHK